MKIFLSVNELTRRIGIARQTLTHRMHEQGIQADAIVINGGKEPGMLFDSDRLPFLRLALSTHKKPL